MAFAIHPFTYSCPTTGVRLGYGCRGEDGTMALNERQSWEEITGDRTRVLQEMLLGQCVQGSTCAMLFAEGGWVTHTVSRRCHGPVGGIEACLRRERKVVEIMLGLAF